ncbi:type II toxin-antitoxin system VapC family toxin [Mucilaginibacter sp. SJ]|uniref:type II toxin-antitoxin system VapC family toxin n=1 Tax=Mucilaginibacter sp. SJ TaxID=3029053 RepID=UPI0023A987FD|nr:PIN domain-containing protein [Mucilaginibacter sp. SJ]WEA00144.1 PIN domain-containing protein [Mucilaginibacter sp. SJ]
MNLLLDTHALIWFTEGNDKLSLTAKKQIEDENNSKAISIASLWEIVIKASRAKLGIEKSFCRNKSIPFN